MRALPVVLLAAALASACAAPPSSRNETRNEFRTEFLAPGLVLTFPPAGAAAADDGHGLLWDLALYLPNRIFDLFDIVRARVRVGPGFGLGLRATEVADLYLGSYLSAWIGLHGYRGEPSIPWPVGLESRSGAEVSVADASIEGGVGPDYGPFEFGLDVQVLLVGVALGIEPFEILDLVTGLIGIDPSGDDF
jgi:hypothetical protein